MTDAAYERTAFALSIVAAVICLIFPLVAIALYETQVELTAIDPAAAEVTVGIAVILRATARRILRASFQNILRTTFGTFSRTFARTATRRFLRFFAHSLFGALSKRAAETEEMDPQLVRGSSVVAVLLGFVGLAFSFWGVMQVARSSNPEAMAGFAAFPTVALCVIAAMPIVVYAVITTLAAKRFAVKVRFETGFDGLLIQGYFTGAGSFLPMTTDIIYRDGSVKQKAKLAATALLSMLVIHWLLHVLAVQLGQSWLEFGSAVFLIYTFVYSFPISPLEGHDVWRFSKLLWLLMFTPIILSFFVLFPSQLAPLL